MSKSKILRAQILTLIHNNGSLGTSSVRFKLKQMGIIKTNATIRRHCKILESLEIVDGWKSHEIKHAANPVYWQTRSAYKSPKKGNITVDQALDHINKITQAKAK